jgi:hypothetical protein
MVNGERTVRRSRLHRRIRPSLWVAIALIVANLFNWARLLSAATEPYTVDPIRDPEVVALLEYIRSGDHGGEAWEVTLTELEAEQTITWYLDRWPQIPFAHPQVEIAPDYIAGEGDATIVGLRVHVRGKGRITLKDGLPVVEILELSIPVPRGIREGIERELQRQIARADQLPVRFTYAEWRDGEVTVRGIIR